MENEILEVKPKEGGSFSVIIQPGIFGETDEATAGVLAKIAEGDELRVIFVADANVVRTLDGLGSRIGRYVNQRNIRMAVPPLVLPGGEKIKQDGSQAAMKVASAIMDARLGVHDAVIAIGGGALLDVAGYAAAITRGGVPLVRVPTTVAAMLESSFATTANLDFTGIKDALRVRSVPAASIIDPALAQTVLLGVWNGSIAELIRHAAVKEPSLLKHIVESMDMLKAHDSETVSEIVQMAVRSRAARGGTPFALWCAERLEAMSAFRLPHGYATAIAICIECAYAVKRGILQEKDQETICRALADCGSLDCLVHSRHLIGQCDNILKGLDALRLVTGSESRVLASGVGKAKREDKPDREIYREVIKAFEDASFDE